jgi:hypothetical protein
MALIYAREAVATLGHYVQVYDANGSRLYSVVACDRLTGEVIQVDLASYSWPKTSKPRALYSRLIRYLYIRFGIDIDVQVRTIHHFAPAPLSFQPLKQAE